MKTSFYLFQQYDSVLVPVEALARDYFGGMKPEHLTKKLTDGDIKIPLVRMDPSSLKSPKGVHIADLAAWIDAQHEAAIKELKQMTS